MKVDRFVGGSLNTSPNRVKTLKAVLSDSHLIKSRAENAKQRFSSKNIHRSELNESLNSTYKPKRNVVIPPKLNTKSLPLKVTSEENKQPAIMKVQERSNSTDSIDTTDKMLSNPDTIKKSKQSLSDLNLAKCSMTDVVEEKKEIHKQMYQKHKNELKVIFIQLLYIS